MEPGNAEMIRQLHLAAGQCLQNEDYAGALNNLDRALALLPETALHARAILLNNAGHAQVSLKNYDGALSSFRSAADTFRRMGEKIGLGEQTGNIGSVYRDLEQWDDSLEAYFQALAIFQEESHERGIADQYSNIAYSFSRKGESGKAVLYFEDAKRLYDKLGDQEKSGLCEQNLQAIRAYAKG